MDEILIVVVFALTSAAIYAVAASGLVLTYTTSGIFNFAHGAIAMISAYVYWQLSSPAAWGLPVPVALVLTIGVFAPGFGYLVDRILMRRLRDAPPIVRLVVPIALLVVLIQVASVLWPPASVLATLPEFFRGESVSIGDVAITYHQIIVIATAVAVAVGLRILLYGTRTGTAMRAVVDDPDLASLNGVNPDRISSLAWALGCALAGVAGILVAPILRLDQVQLTFLVINAYAAAMVGRLRSFQLTVVGAIILGFARELVRKYNTDLPGWINVDTVPVLMLFVVLLVVPQDKAALFSERKDRLRVPNPSVSVAAVAGLLLVGAAAVTPSLMTGSILASLGTGMALAIVALSLVPLTGYAGQISLAPLAFAGIGAVVMALVAQDGNALGLVVVAVVCAAVGAAVALPTLRLKGLYLALATMAFALFCEKAVFNQVESFRNTADYGRLHLLGIHTDSPRANLIAMAAIFALMGVGLTALRRGPFGRRLQAMKDSPAACATIGLNTSFTKLWVFALSAAIAGVGGALLAGWRTQAGPQQFGLLEGTFPALPLVLLAVVGGITAVAGALLGAILLVLMPHVGETYPVLRNLMTVLPGIAGISLAINPNGAISQTVTQFRARSDKRGAEVSDEESTPSPTLALLAPAPTAIVPEHIAVGASADPATLVALDRELGLSWGRSDADA